MVVIQHIIMEDEDDDLEALRLAALQTIRPRVQTKKQQNPQHRHTGKRFQAPFIRPSTNPNLIAIVPTEVLPVSVESTKTAPTAPSPIKCPKKNETPKKSQNIPEPHTHEEAVKKVEPPTTAVKKIRASVDEKKTFDSSGDGFELEEDVLDFETESLDESGGEDDLLELHDSDSDSLEKLMEDIEKELSEPATSKVASKPTSRSQARSQPAPKQTDPANSSNQHKSPPKTGPPSNKPKSPNRVAQVKSKTKSPPKVDNVKVESPKPSSTYDKPSPPRRRYSPPRHISPFYRPSDRWSPSHRGLSPSLRTRSITPRKRSLSPRKRSFSPRWRSPSPRRSSPYRKRSITPCKRSLTPRKRSITPRKRSLSPRKRSLTPRKRSLSPRKRSLTPRKRSLTPRKRSITPRKRSLTPRKRSLTPWRRSLTPLKRSLSPRKSSLTPRKRSLTPRRRSMSPRKRSLSPRRRSISPRRYSPRRRSISPRRRRSISPRRRSLSPWRNLRRRSPSAGRRSPSPIRKRSSSPLHSPIKRKRPLSPLNSKRPRQRSFCRTKQQPISNSSNRPNNSAKVRYRAAREVTSEKREEERERKTSGSVKEPKEIPKSKDKTVEVVERKDKSEEPPHPLNPKLEARKRKFENNYVIESVSKKIRLKSERDENSKKIISEDSDTVVPPSENSQHESHGPEALKVERTRPDVSRLEKLHNDLKTEKSRSEGNRVEKLRLESSNRSEKMQMNSVKEKNGTDSTRAEKSGSESNRTERVRLGLAKAISESVKSRLDNTKTEKRSENSKPEIKTENTSSPRGSGQSNREATSKSKSSKRKRITLTEEKVEKDLSPEPANKLKDNQALKNSTNLWRRELEAEEIERVEDLEEEEPVVVQEKKRKKGDTSSKEHGGDLRAELSRRRAERLKGGQSSFDHMARIVQSAFEGVVGKTKSKSRASPAPDKQTYTLPEKRKKESRPKGRRVFSVSSSSKSYGKKTDDEGKKPILLRGDQRHNSPPRTSGRSILRRNQV